MHMSTLCNLVMSATHRQIEADIPLWHYVSLLFCYLNTVACGLGALTVVCKLVLIGAAVCSCPLSVLVGLKFSTVVSEEHNKGPNLIFPLNMKFDLNCISWSLGNCCTGGSETGGGICHCSHDTYVWYKILMPRYHIYVMVQMYPMPVFGPQLVVGHRRQALGLPAVQILLWYCGQVKCNIGQSFFCVRHSL